MIFLAYYLTKWVRSVQEVLSRIKPPQRAPRPTWVVRDHPSFVQNDEDNVAFGVVKPHILNHAEVVELRKHTGYQPDGDDAA